MSHLRERKEKNCLNCQATLYGRYCHVCGQENLEPKETVWHLVQHFFNDITHFDGKFFATVKDLLWRPGFLSREYFNGRRASYLNPIRMYVFTSAIFFLILFAMKDPKDLVNVSDKPEKGKSVAALKQDRVKLLEELTQDEDRGDSTGTEGDIAKLDVELNAIKKYYGDTTTRIFTSGDLGLLLVREVKDSLPELHDLVSDLPQKQQQAVAARVRRAARKYGSINSGDDDDTGMSFFGMNSEHYRTGEAYDSAQKALPDSMRDGWLRRAVKHKIITANVEYRRDRNEYFQHVAENILHSIPKVLFVSLPLFALILNIMYFRRRKTFYYVDHGIFTIHLYCATFILAMAVLLLNQLSHAVGTGWVKVVSNILIFALSIYSTIYLYKAMRGFYRQRRFKTFIKYCLVCLLSFIVNSIIFVIFVLLSVVSV